MTVVLALLLSSWAVLFLLTFFDFERDLSAILQSCLGYLISFYFYFSLVKPWCRLLTEGLFIFNDCFFVILAY